MFKLGDKVETSFGVGYVTGYTAGLTVKVQIGYPNKSDYQYDLVFNESEVKPYKTAHDKLIDLGYQYKEHRNNFSKRQDSIVTYTIPYSFDGEGTHIHINKENKKLTIFISSVIENGEAAAYVPVNLELSKILVQYLEELQDDK